MTHFHFMFLCRNYMIYNENHYECTSMWVAFRHAPPHKLPSVGTISMARQCYTPQTRRHEGEMSNITYIHVVRDETIQGCASARACVLWGMCVCYHVCSQACVLSRVRANDDVCVCVHMCVSVGANRPCVLQQEEMPCEVHSGVKKVIPFCENSYSVLFKFQSSQQAMCVSVGGHALRGAQRRGPNHSVLLKSQSSRGNGIHKVRSAHQCSASANPLASHCLLNIEGRIALYDTLGTLRGGSHLMTLLEH